jgi:hypothetical protein
MRYILTAVGVNPETMTKSVLARQVARAIAAQLKFKLEMKYGPALKAAFTIVDAGGLAYNLSGFPDPFLRIETMEEPEEYPLPDVEEIIQSLMPLMDALQMCIHVGKQIVVPSQLTPTSKNANARVCARQTTPRSPAAMSMTDIPPNRQIKRNYPSFPFCLLAIFLTYFAGSPPRLARRDRCQEINPWRRALLK